MLLKLFNTAKIKLAQGRFISISVQYNLNQKWRRERGLPLNPNREGVLTNGADYSFMDGRVTPCGVGRKRRVLEQRQLTQKIIELSSEIDFAVERHEKLKLEKINQRKLVLDSKLKPKGLELSIKK